jgi:hypothetical protein
MARRRKVYRQAARDVRLSNKPSLQAIKRETKRGTNEFGDYMAAADSAYRGLINELQGLNPQYNQISNNIADTLNTQLSGLAGLLGTANPEPAPEGSPEGIAYGTPAGEAAAAAGLYGTLGAGGLELLASQRQRNLGYTTSAKRQGAIERETAQTNLVQDYKDFLQEMRDRRLGITSTMPVEIRQRMDQIRQQNLQNRLARQQMALAQQEAASNAALNEFLSSQISGLLATDNVKSTTTKSGSKKKQEPTVNEQANTAIREGGPYATDETGNSRESRILKMYRQEIGPPPPGPYTPEMLRGMLQAIRRARRTRTYTSEYEGGSNIYEPGLLDTPVTLLDIIANWLGG